jgi:hypothetical protein
MDDFDSKDRICYTKNIMTLAIKKLPSLQIDQKLSTSPKSGLK